MAKNTAPKRGASRTPPPSKREIPNWLWMACGLAVGGFAMFLTRLEPGSDAVKRSTGEPPAKTTVQTPQPDKPKYDFYTLLPESKVVVPPTAQQQPSPAKPRGPAATPSSVLDVTAQVAGETLRVMSGIEAVALETPPCFFPEHARAAVESGLHVYMAKPVAVDVPGCMEIEAAATKAAAAAAPAGPPPDRGVHLTDGPLFIPAGFKLAPNGEFDFTLHLHGAPAVVEANFVAAKCPGVLANVTLPGLRGESVVIALDQKGIALSSGSACRAGSPEPSHALIAMGLSDAEAHCSLRFSLGPDNTAAQIDRTLEAIEKMLQETHRGETTIEG